MTSGKNTPVPTFEDPLDDLADSNDENIEVIADRFVVMKMLGQGGMGRVYRAHDKLLDRDVAVKLLNRELKDDYFVRRFQQEARAASQLKHSNILCVLDFGLVSQTQPYLVMEWVDGSTLDQCIVRNGKFSVRHAVEICIRLAEGMQHAHRNGIIHRDLKPSNIMLSKSELGERVLILDFGIAKMVDDPTESGMLTMTGQIIGSPRCISPEQARGEQLDGRSDIYSLGCVMFEMFTGKPPFRGETALTTIAMHLNEPVPLLSEVSDTTFPEGLEEIICKSMSKNQKDRFASMEELQAKLKALDLESFSEISPTVDQSEPVKPRGIVIDTRVAIGLLLLAAIPLTVFFVQGTEHDQGYDKVAVKEPTKTGQHLDKNDPHAKNAMLQDPNVVDFEFNKRFYKNRGLAEADRVMINSTTKTGVDLDKSLNDHPKAFHMRMYKVDITPDMVAIIERRSNLKELRLQSCTIAPELQLRLCKIANLEALKFVEMPLSVAQLKQIRKLPKLIDFQVYKGKLTNDELVEISKLSKLQVLEISDNRSSFSQPALKSLADLKTLKKLKFEFNGLDNSDLNWICTLKNLDTLGLSGNGPFTHDGLRKLASLEKLTHLHLANTKLNDKCLLAISKIPNLTFLDVSSNSDITAGGLQYLKGRPDLKVIVAKTAIEQASVEKLSAQLNLKVSISATASNTLVDFLMAND